MDNFHSPAQYLGISLPGKGHTEGLILLFLQPAQPRLQQLGKESVILWNPFQNGKAFKVLTEIFSLRGTTSGGSGSMNLQLVLPAIRGNQLLSLSWYTNVNTLRVYYSLCYFIIYWFDLFICSFVIYCLQQQHCPAKIFYQCGIKFFLPPKTPCFDSLHHFPLSFHSILRCCPTVSLQI